MKKFVLFICVCSIFTLVTYAKELKKIDDWDLNVTIPIEDKILYSMPRNMNALASMGGNVSPAPMLAARPKSMMVRKSRKIGMAVGGAKDTDNFIENIKHGYIPKIDSLTYEGTFYQHYFDTGIFSSFLIRLASSLFAHLTAVL